MTCNLIEKEKFDVLSNAEKRVEIAKDVIARLRADKIISDPGSLMGDCDEIELSDLSAQDFFNNKPCHVCAKGALICSWVGNFNHYSKAEFGRFNYDFRIGSKTYPKELIDLFGMEQLSIIEREFEQSQYGWCVVKNIDFRPNYSSPYHKNLRTIMENIVKNKGTFIP